MRSLSSTCEKDVHFELYDPENGETFCGICGLVLTEVSVEFENHVYTPPRRHLAPYSIRRKVHETRKPELIEVMEKLLAKRQTPADPRNKAFEICVGLRKLEKQTSRELETTCKAIIYTANRLCGEWQSVAELAETSRERRQILRHHRQVCRLLNLQMPKSRLRDVLHFIAKETDASAETEECAFELLAGAESRLLLRGSNPSGMAAAALYLVSPSTRESRTQKEIAKVAGVSEVTIRTDCRILKSVFRQPDRKRRV